MADGEGGCTQRTDDRVLVARIAAAERWGHTRDRTAATEPARRGLRAKFRSRGTSMSSSPQVSVSTVLVRLRLRELPRLHPSGACLS